MEIFFPETAQGSIKKMKYLKDGKMLPMLNLT